MFTCAHTYAHELAKAISSNALQDMGGQKKSSQWWQVLFQVRGRTAASYGNTAAAAFPSSEETRCSSSTRVQPVAEKHTALWQWISFTWFNCIGRDQERKERAQAGLGQSPGESRSTCLSSLRQSVKRGEVEIGEDPLLLGCEEERCVWRGKHRL